MTKEEISQIAEDVVAVSAENERLQARVAELEARNLELRSLREALLTDREHLQAHVAELEAANEKLHMQVACLVKSCADLSGKSLAKDARVAELEADNLKLEADVVYWKAKFEQEERLRDGPNLTSTVMERK